MASPHCRDMGPCRLVWGVQTLSPVFEAATLKIEETEAEVKNSENGETPVDIVTTGVKATLETAISGYTLTELNALFANGAMVSTTGFKLLNSVGHARSADKADLTIKPLVNGVLSVTEAEWTVLHNAVPKIGAEITFDNGTQRAIQVTFTGLAPATATAPIVSFADVTA